jgi:hypothetical protein
MQDIVTLIESTARRPAFHHWTPNSFGELQG